MSTNTSADAADPAPGRAECAPTRSRRAELEQAYRKARYCVETADGSWVLRIDRAADEVAAWMAGHGTHRLVVLTACNPGSQPLTEEENQQRQQRLERAVTEQGLRAWPACNRDPLGHWPDEPGLAIADLPEHLLARWLETFGQNAAVLLEPPAPPRLVWRAGRTGRPVPPPGDAD
ncbi:DUF3293 domain-containing protein [Thioalkalivibrio sp. ALE31]|uniref:DUF3293 domain-containing protein n=1 Tax=Thioalkalivibrio sp. ALE31 TaxID=1158182 RepID=UPI0005713E9F|nr:DUF3293 domain-containing protein [Thioalkalivibrio sp. ALE31]